MYGLDGFMDGEDHMITGYKKGVYLLRSSRRMRTILTCILLSLFVLTGCGGSSGESAPAADQEADAGIEHNSSAGGGTKEDRDPQDEKGKDQDSPGNDELQAVFFDVGKGDCILLTMGEDHILLDAGYEETWQSVVRELNSRGVDSLDAMIITHYDKDHVGGAAEIAQQIPVDTFYLPDYEGELNKSGDLLDYIKKKGVESIRVSEQEELSLGQARVEIDPALIPYNLQEENDNDASLIVKIFYEEDEWLLPGDIERDAIEVWLGENTQTFDVLKMPHHGGKEKNTKELLENTSPEIAVITDSSAEEASEKVLKQLEKRDIAVYRSSANGTITIIGDGSGSYDVTSDR